MTTSDGDEQRESQWTQRVATCEWWSSLLGRGRIVVDGVDGRVALPIWQDGNIGSGLRVTVETNRAFGGVRTQVFVTATDGPVELQEFWLEYNLALSVDDRIVCNGFQSWTETARYAPDAEMPPMNPGVRHAMGPLGDDTFLPYTGAPGELRSWTYTVVRPRHESPLFLGSMNDDKAYTAFEFRHRQGCLRIWKDVLGWSLAPGVATCVFDIWLKFGAEDAGLSTWTRQLGHSSRAEQRLPAIAGWTSWYHHYTDIDAALILDNVDEMAANRVPLDVFQIDDGWQVDIGTWTPNGKFPDGMKSLAEKIHQRGYDAGLWLAPFIAEDRSKILQEHPEWVATDENGERVHAGYNPLWSGYYWALDTEREDVRAYAHECVRRALHDWNFDLVKLDFLFAAGLRARPGRTRAQQMTDALDLLRDAAGDDKRILGCGAPLASAFGRVDYCRVGPDVSLGWEDPFTKMLEHRERPSTQMTIKNTLVRAGLSGRVFLCDPDVFILRDENTSLSVEERHTLALCNLFAGDVSFTSDDLSTYDDNKYRLLFSQFPPRRFYQFDLEEHEDRMVASATIGDSLFRLFVNFQESDANVLIDDDVVLENDLAPNGAHRFGIRLHARDDRLCIPAHGARIVKVCPPPLGDKDDARVLGSNGHFFPGAEVAAISSDISIDSPNSTFDVSLTLATKARGADLVWIEVPPGHDVVKVDGKRFSVRQIQGRRIVEVAVRPPRWRRNHYSAKV